MDETAQSSKDRVLLAGFGAYLSRYLAKSLIARNCLVYAIANKAPNDLVNDRSFTLLNIDPSQPFPQYLPTFDMVFYFQNLEFVQNTIQIKNLISSANNQQSKLFLILTLRSETPVLEDLPKLKNTQVLLVGDVYGPALELEKDDASQNLLVDLISQAVQTDKIILKNEGKDLIYPTYITDAVFAINKFAYGHTSKKTHLIISEKPRESLDIAYEIQNQIGFTLNKKIDLFFLDEGKTNTPVTPEPVINISDPTYLPKIKLTAGLKQLFDSIKKDQEGRKDQSQEAINQVDKGQNKTTNKSTQKTFKIPKIPVSSLPGLSGRKFAVIAIILMLLFGAKLLTDFYFGFNSLKKAAQSAKIGDFGSASISAQTAQKKIQGGTRIVRIATIPVSLIAKNKVEAIDLTLTSTYQAANSIENFSQGANLFLKNLKAITNPNIMDTSVDFEQSSASLEKAYFQSAQSLELAKMAKDQKIFKNYLTELENSQELVQNIASSLYQLSSLLPAAIGTERKTYLVLVMDENLLRPGAGQFQSYGEITFEDGKLKSFSLEDIASLDANLKQKLPPPKPLAQKLKEKQLTFKDSNFGLDFGQNAKIFQDLFESETGKSADGVIALDLTFLKSLLALTGPIEIDNLQINSANLDQIQAGNDLVRFTEALIQKIIDQNIMNKNPNYATLLREISLGFSQKHLFFVSKDENLAAFTNAKFLANSLPPPSFDPANDNSSSRDFIALAEANLSGIRINNQIERKIDYQIDINSEASIQARLKLNYKNSSAQNYLAYLKLHVPFLTTLLEFKIGETSKIKEVEAQNELNLSTFSTYIEIPKESQQELTFTYKLGKSIRLEQAPTYHLYIQKQPGTKQDPLNFSLNLPQFLKIESVNGSQKVEGARSFKIETDLPQDRSFEIAVTKQ